MSTDKMAISSITTPLATLSWSMLQLGELIGSGGYGDVYKATWQGIDVAVKQLHLRTLSADLTTDFQKEATIMAQCQFPYVVHLYGVCQEPGHTAMVMEYLPKGSLYQVLHDSKEPLLWNPVRWNIAIDMGKGLSYLHSQKIVHRDLKSLNVLLDSQYRAKITDFGLAKIKLETNSTTTKTKQVMGTTRWRAPELFKRNASPNVASDIYSYGMVLWEIASRQLPFHDAVDEITVMGWIKDGEQEKIPADAPASYAAMIQQAWQTSEKRPQAHEMLVALRKERALTATSLPTFTVKDTKVVWGRRQTPDQQPVYYVESAKVSGQAIGAFFKPQDKPYSVGWLGKLGYFRGLTSTSTPQMAIHSVVRRSSALEALAEKMAADLYAYLSEGNYRVPKTRLAELPIKNAYTEQHALTEVLYGEINEGRKEAIDEGVYVLSKRVEGYQDLAKLKECVLQEEQKEFTAFLKEGKLPEHVILDGKKLPLLGLMEILAAGRLLADTDVLGGGGNNAGVVMKYDATGEAIAVGAVKIDPGYAFNFRGMENLFFQSKNPAAHSSNLLREDKRNLQYGNHHTRVLPWYNLTLSQQQQFIQALDRGLKVLRKTEEIAKMVNNREAFKQTPKKRSLPSLGEVLGGIEENLIWQEETYTNELKECRALVDGPVYQAPITTRLIPSSTPTTQVNSSTTTINSSFMPQADPGKNCSELPKSPQPPAKSDSPSMKKVPAAANYQSGNSLYIKGQYKQSLSYFEIAAEQGYPAAYLRLWRLYEGNMGIPKDHHKSQFYRQQVVSNINWFQMEAKKGEADAQANLARCYEQGLGVPKDLTQAVKYYRLAADQGDAAAQNNLGWCYETGQGVTKNLVKAAKYYQLAANQGNMYAQKNLGLCYQTGEGVKKDLAQAAKYYQLAMEQGNRDVQIYLEDLLLKQHPHLESQQQQPAHSQTPFFSSSSLGAVNTIVATSTTRTMTTTNVTSTHSPTPY